MKVLVLLVSLTAFVSAGTVPEYSQINPVYGYLKKYAIPEAERIQKAEEAYLSGLSSRIIGGNLAMESQIPYQAGLIIDIVGSNGRGVCGGSLITPLKVLSAAHCWFDGRNHGWRITVVLGSNLLFSGGTRVTTTRVDTHENWIPWLIRNDVMIITLPNPVRLTAAINVIEIPSGALLNENFAGSHATTSGFGLTDINGTISANQGLSYVRVTVIANSACNLAYPTIIQDSHICTSGLGGSGPSQGDSGGPLVAERGGRIYQIGIVSFGSALSQLLPAVYSRVTEFYSTIQEHM